MTISYNWLMTYLPIKLPVDDLANILTAIGLEVEGVEAIGAWPKSLDGLFIGQVLTCSKHPNADKLKVTSVAIHKDEPLTIVCGAPNVAEGQKVVVATVGATLYPLQGPPFTIKESKIRGALSEGMLCAEDEIGIGESHDGIIVLPPDTPVGKPLEEVLERPIADHIIHIGLTPNRTDAMSHIGVARDVAAYLSHHRGLSTGVSLPDSAPLPQEGAHPIQVTIAEPQACLRYAGVLLTGIRIEPSPHWMRQRLQAIGLRPINNVVDITNYVLHEYGQPLHAFDATAIQGNTVRVGFLPEGTAFKTLDGQERSLSADDLMICNEQSGMCIAGVFGGIDSGVSMQTTAVFLESAHFDRLHVRRTSTRLGLRTDAATRFEKGADIDLVIPALERAASLMVAHCGAQVSGAVQDVYPSPIPHRIINTSVAFIQQLSGKNYDLVTIQSILTSLRYEVAAQADGGLSIVVPHSKAEVSQPADIVGDLIRIDGLDQIDIPSKLITTLLPQLPNDRREREAASNLLTGMGFQEIVTNSITNSKYYPDETALVRMMNSLSSELDVMRPAMLESGLEVIQYNVNRRNEDLMLYEIGKIYHGDTAGYREQTHLALWVTGRVREGGWQEPPMQTSLYFLKGVIENLAGRCGLATILKTVVASNDEIVWMWGEAPVARLWEVSEERLRAFDIKKPVFHAIVFWEVWVQAMAAQKIQFQEVPRYPAVTRDLSLLLPMHITYEQVAAETDALQLPALIGYRLFDVFINEKLGDHHKAYALSYTFQLKDRTLTDAEVEAQIAKLTSAYEKRLGVSVRG